MVAAGRIRVSDFFDFFSYAKFLVCKYVLYSHMLLCTSDVVHPYDMIDNNEAAREFGLT